MVHSISMFHHERRGWPKSGQAYKIQLPCWPDALVDQPQHALLDSPRAECERCGMVCRYHTGPGFFVNTYLVFLTVSASIWVYLLLALAGAQTFACPTRADPQKMCSTLTGAAVRPHRIVS